MKFEHVESLNLIDFGRSGYKILQLKKNIRNEKKLKELMTNLVIKITTPMEVGNSPCSTCQTNHKSNKLHQKQLGGKRNSHSMQAKMCELTISRGFVLGS